MSGTSNRRTGQGRKSMEALMAIPAGPGMEKPEPPEDFSDDEKVVWHSITEDCPPDWFTAGCTHLLAKLCSVMVMSDQLEARWRADDMQWLDKDDRVAYNAMINSIGQLTTKLRLSPQSRYNRIEAGTRMRNRPSHRMWEGEAA